MAKAVQVERQGEKEKEGGVNRKRKLNVERGDRVEGEGTKDGKGR